MVATMSDQFFVYLLTNKTNAVLYTGVTNDLVRRVYEHREKVVPGFTARYNVTKLVNCEVFSDARHAIKREKQIKGGSRRKKMELISSTNPEWQDLWADIATV